MTPTLRGLSSIFRPVVLAAGLLGFVSHAQAVPAAFTYTGELTASNGLPYNGEVEAVARLYGGASGGSPLWTGPLESVLVEGGVFALDLSGAPLLALFSQHSNVWAEFEVDGETLSPRQQLTSVPYAATAGNAQQLGGLPPSAYVSASAPLAPSLLPTSGLGEVSNAVLDNEFKGVLAPFTGGSVPIQDAPGPGASAAVTTAEQGNSYVTSLTVTASVSLTFKSTLRITLYPPLGSGIAPIVAFEGLRLAGNHSFQWTPGNLPALTAMLGAKMAGDWSIQVLDLDDDAAPGVVVGTLDAFQIAYDAVRSNHAVVNGRLDVSGVLNVGSNLAVAGNATVTGKIASSSSIIGRYVGASFHCNAHAQAGGWTPYCASNIGWNNATEHLSINPNGTVTATTPGFYRVEFYADQLLACSASVQLSVVVNGSGVRGYERKITDGGWHTGVISQVVRLQAGDTIRIDAYQGCGTNSGYAYHLGPYWSNFQITLVGTL
jgi:subtilisin-like proprotein convertase family protein